MITKTMVRRTWLLGDPLRDAWEQHWRAVKDAGIKVRTLSGRPNYLGGLPFAVACKRIKEAR
jgi:hypothetical protein